MSQIQITAFNTTLAKQAGSYLGSNLSPQPRQARPSLDDGIEQVRCEIAQQCRQLLASGNRAAWTPGHRPTPRPAQRKTRIPQHTAASPQPATDTAVLSWPPQHVLNASASVMLWKVPASAHASRPFLMVETSQSATYVWAVKAQQNQSSKSMKGLL